MYKLVGLLSLVLSFHLYAPPESNFVACKPGEAKHIDGKMEHPHLIWVNNPFGDITIREQRSSTVRGEIEVASGEDVDPDGYALSFYRQGKVLIVTVLDAATRDSGRQGRQLAELIKNQAPQGKINAVNIWLYLPNKHLSDTMVLSVNGNILFQGLGAPPVEGTDAIIQGRTLFADTKGKVEAQNEGFPGGMVLNQNLYPGSRCEDILALEGLIKERFRFGSKG